MTTNVGASLRGRLYLPTLILGEVYGVPTEGHPSLLFQYVREFAGVTLPQAERDALVAGLKARTETRPTRVPQGFGE